MEASVQTEKISQNYMQNERNKALMKIFYSNHLK